MSRIVAPRREWICSVNSRLDAATSWMKVIPCTDSAVQGNDFELFPTTRMERGHSVEGSFSREFSSIYIVRELWPSEVGSRSRCYRKTCVFGKNDRLREDFQNFVPKGFIATQIHVLCANFVKFGLPKIGKVVRYLPHQKKQNFGSVSRSRVCADLAQNLPGQRQTMYSQCPRFYPNRFTSGGVIAVQTRHKMFPVLCEASASSPSN